MKMKSTRTIRLILKKSSIHFKIFIRINNKIKVSFNASDYTPAIFCARASTVQEASYGNLQNEIISIGFLMFADSIDSINPLLLFLFLYVNIYVFFEE